MMKKYVKKMVAVAMAAAMVMPMACMNALAGEVVNEESDDTNGKTTVKYDVTQSYKWSVPSTIDFTNAENATVTADGSVGSATQKVMVTENIIPAGKKLQIAAKGSGTENNAFEIVSVEGKKLGYTINIGDKEISSGDSILSVEAGTNTGNATLIFKLKKDNVEQAGNYKGTVTYTASIVDQI